MKIKTIVSQHRRDLQLILICEHCESEEKSSGYDDAYFHNNVLPDRACKSCLLKSPASSQPMAPKYSEHQTV